MAKPGAATIKLGKSKYKINFGFEALAEVEARTRINLMKRSPEDMNVREFATFVWAVIDHSPKPKLEAIQAQVGLHNIRTLQQTLLDAWADALPQPEFEDPKADSAWHRLKAYFRTDPTKWKSDFTAEIFADMRSQLETLETTIVGVKDEPELEPEGNASTTGTTTSQ
jgi:hypothetical protein